MDKNKDGHVHRIEKLSRVLEQMLENVAGIQELLDHQKEAVEQLQSVLSSMEKTRQLLVLSKQANPKEDPNYAPVWRHFEDIGVNLQKVLRIQEQLLAETFSRSSQQSQKSARLLNEVAMLKQKFSH